MNQETLLFEPAAAQQGALRAVLAFPSTYTVGITSLGYQVVWEILENAMLMILEPSKYSH